MNYQQTRALALLKLARFLMTQSDTKGLTHADKHFLIQTALFIQHLAAKEISGEFDWHARTVDDIKPDDIPF